MKSSNKTLIIFSAIHIYCTGVVAAKDALSTPQFMSMLNTCAAGSKTKFNGDLIGSVESLYQGQSTRGSATFSTETEFLNRLPEHQKFEGYRLYIECIKAIMLDPGKQKNALQIELMEHLSKDTPYSKITEAFGQPIKIKKLYNSGQSLKIEGGVVDLRHFRGESVDLIIAYTNTRRLLGVGVYTQNNKSNAHIPYLTMGIEEKPGKTEWFSNLSHIKMSALIRICSVDKLDAPHVRFVYFTSPKCYFGAPGGYMNFHFVYQPAENVFKNCKIDVYSSLNLKNFRCSTFFEMTPDLAFVSFVDELPDDITDTIMEWIYNFAQ